MKTQKNNENTRHNPQDPLFNLFGLFNSSCWKTHFRPLLSLVILIFCSYLAIYYILPLTPLENWLQQLLNLN